jgi:hydrogenase-4 component B
MTSTLLIGAWLWPLLLAGALGLLPDGAQRGNLDSAGPGRRSRPRLWLLPALGSLPGLAAGLLVPVGSTLDLPWLFLGTTLGLDAIGRVFLLFTSTLWLVAGVHAAWNFRDAVHGRRFGALFLLAMAGNLWLIVGQDLASFYLGFAMMSLSSYGLVIHNGDPAALRAGKVYLVLTLLGEVTLFAALVLIALDAGSMNPTPDQLGSLDDLTIGLTIAGLAVKAGLVPLHLWLPLAHPAAPVPASAVLSGTMIKVALLGWLRFLPFGEAALPVWGQLLTAAGLLTLFFALPIGMVQRDPKVVLAYSSIAKMGLMILALGLMLTEPALAPAGAMAIALYAAHHGLVKGGLFLGVGMRKHAPWQPWVMTGIAFLLLALAGLPFTGGAVVKYGVKPLLADADWTWITAAVAVSTIATTLLMVRFAWVIDQTASHPESGWLWPSLAWLVLLVLVVLFPFVLGKPAAWKVNALTVPIGLGIAGAVALIAWRWPAVTRPFVGRVPPGDLLALLQPIGRIAARIGAWSLRPLQRLADRTAALVRATLAPLDQPGGDSEAWLRAWPVAGALWLCLACGLALLLFLP